MTQPIPIRQPDFTPRPLTLWEALHELWRARPCYICERRGNCGHREPEIDAAWLRAMGAIE